MKCHFLNKGIKKKKNLSMKIGILFVCIFFLVYQMFSWFSNKASPKLITVAEKNIEKYVTHVASDFKLLLEKNNTDQFLIVKENKEGEITSMDYDMVKIYEMAEKFTNSLEMNMADTEELSKFVNVDSKPISNGFLFLYPMGIVSDSVFIQYIGSVFSTVKTRAKNYGINNALLEVYLEIKITYEILTPVTQKENTLSYEILLDSKVIQGVVPNLYGGYMETRSAFFDISFP